MLNLSIVPKCGQSRFPVGHSSVYRAGDFSARLHTNWAVVLGWKVHGLGRPAESKHDFFLNDQNKVETLLMYLNDLISSGNRMNRDL